MSGVNKRIPDLDPNGALQPNYLLAVYNSDNDTTERVPVSQFIPVSSNNFEWLSSPETYVTGDVVTYQGLWYQAVADSEGVVPGTDEDFWVEVSKSASGFVFWVAGAFPQDEVFVLSAHNGQVQQFTLVSGTRPYVSTDIAAEEDAGDWVSITEVLQTVEVATDVSDIEINFRRHREKNYYGSDPIDSPKTLSLLQTINAQKFSFTVQVDDVAATIQFPVGFISEEANWNSSTRTWTPQFEGRYNFIASKRNTSWLLERVQGLYI